MDALLRAKMDAQKEQPVATEEIGVGLDGGTALEIEETAAVPEPGSESAAAALAAPSSLDGLSVKHKAYLNNKMNRRKYSAATVLKQQSGDGNGALWCMAAVVFFIIAIILLLTSCPQRAGINYCGPAFTEYKGAVLTAKQIDHCGNDDYHCSPVLTYSYGGKVLHDKGGNYTGYSRGHSCEIQGVTTETNIGMKHLYRVYGQPLGSTAVIYASATNLCHLEKPMYEMFAASIAMWILFFFSFTLCCTAMVAAPLPETALPSASASASAEDDTAKAEVFFGAYRKSRDRKDLTLSFGIRKSDQTDYVFGVHRRSACTRAHLVNNSQRAYGPCLFTVGAPTQPLVGARVGAGLVGGAVKTLIDAEVGRICNEANEKRIRLALAVGACPHLSLADMAYARLWNISSCLLRLLAGLVLLALYPLIIVADFFLTSLCGSARLAARILWFEDYFAKHPELDTFAIDDVVATEMRALSKRVAQMLAADAADDSRATKLYVGFTTETDDEKVESHDGGSNGWISHWYVVWDTFKLNFYTSAADAGATAGAGAGAGDGDEEA